MKNIFLTFFGIACFTQILFAQNVKPGKVERIDPPCWFTGMKNHGVQLLVYGKNISSLQPQLNFQGVTIGKVDRAQNPDYLYIDLEISDQAQAGIFPIAFMNGKKKICSFNYTLLSRDKESLRAGFDASDVIYLIMPDRFSNGDTLNDNQKDMDEKVRRSNPDGRHGGDLLGIMNHLDYFKSLGVTSLWMTPVFENNNPAYSYHGYAITDLYRVDPRLGSNELYKELVLKAHQNGLKVIMDMVFNHASTHGSIIKNLPDSNWVNHHKKYTKSNFRASAVTDPYASEYDRNLMLTGWFDGHMADLNQNDERLFTYLYQNSVWWIEYAGIDAIRMDTWPYPFKIPMSRWAKQIQADYPGFTILAETWEQKESITAAWQEGSNLQNGFSTGVTSVTDFPLSYALTTAFNEPESWTGGLLRLYYHMAQDFLFPFPEKVVAFADNHDLTRFYESIGKDIQKFKMAMAFLMTTRRIPQLYYGTEIAMTGIKEKGDGFIREDFPGGWPGDKVNAFTGAGLSNDALEAQNFMKTLLNWRKNKSCIHSGAMKQFVPDKGIYVYFRYNEKETIMVVLNHNDTEKTFSTDRYAECMGQFNKGFEITQQRELSNLEKITIPANSAMVIDLQ